MTTTLKIDFVSDVSCPWCVIGLKALDQALARVAPDITAELHFQPFELNPTMGPAGQDITEHITQKYGISAEQAEANREAIRQRGAALGLPHDMVYRHPFPGPGLGVRILGEVKQEYADLLRRADAIFIEELRNFKDADSGKNWYDLTSQAFTVFLPVKSVGVMGDGRTYEYVVALRAVQTSDFMTADWAELPYALLKKVSGRIINEVRGINRVTYDVSSKPPATIEWE